MAQQERASQCHCSLCALGRPLHGKLFDTSAERSLQTLTTNPVPLPQPNPRRPRHDGRHERDRPLRPRLHRNNQIHRPNGTPVQTQVLLRRRLQKPNRRLFRRFHQAKSRLLQWSRCLSQRWRSGVSLGSLLEDCVFKPCWHGDFVHPGHYAFYYG